VLWGAQRVRLVTMQHITLTQDELRLSDGVVLARVADVASVVRGTFAFKPSHGFVVILKEPSRGGWAPGMWWRLGRRIGIGGVLPRNASKFMAERLALLIAERDGAS